MRKKIKYPTKYQISEHQFEDTFAEFVQRSIFKVDINNTINITPKLFEDWLLGNGIYQVISQMEDKDEILDEVVQESKLYISDNELEEVDKFLGETSSKHGVSNLRNFLNQFSNNASKRLIVDLIKKTLVINGSEVLNHLKKIKKQIWQDGLTIGIGEHNIRKDAEIFNFPLTANQNKPILDLLKNEFKINKLRSIKSTDSNFELEPDIKNILLYEPLIDCPYYYRNEVAKFLKRIKPTLVKKISIHIICTIITDEAKNEIERLITDYFSFNVSLHALKVVQRSDISPFLNNADSINDPTWKVVSNVYKKLNDSSCAVKIGTLIPYQVFPIFWSTTISKFKPLFDHGASQNNVYDFRLSVSEELKKIRFESESSNLEFKASLKEPSQNWKTINVQTAKYKKLPDGDEASLLLAKEIDKLYHLRLTDPERLEISKSIMHSIAKTIAAFANTSGGYLYVGIEDDLTIRGIEPDMRVHKNEEGIRRLLDEILKNYIGNEYDCISQLSFEKVMNDVSILKIQVKKYSSDIWVIKDSGGKDIGHNPEFFIRRQQETVKLSTREYATWNKK